MRSRSNGEGGMSVKRIWTMTVGTLLLSVAATQAQMPTAVPFADRPMMPVPPYLDRPTQPNTVLPPDTTSPLTAPLPADCSTLPPTEAWLGGHQANCCGPAGDHGPIGTEVYARTGPSFLLTDSPFAKGLNNGWEVSGGGRTLFFDPGATAAWTIGLGIDYIYNRGELNATFLLRPTFFPASENYIIRNLDRTGVSLNLGREWYTNLPPLFDSMPEANLRYGFDFGGIWGTTHVDLVPFGQPNNYERIHTVFGSALFGMFADVEVPVGAWAWTFGVRLEYRYDTFQFLPTWGNDLQMLNFTLYTGVKY